MKHLSLALLALLLAFLAAITLFIGKFELNLSEYAAIFSADHSVAKVVLLDIRFPRIAAAVLIGAALSVSGAAYQAMLINPLVSPSILGVLSGAGFGAALAMILGLSIVQMQMLTFVMGIAAVVIAFMLSLISRAQPLLMLILGGVISSAIFGALLSVLKYFADPYDTLPNIVYFLMGSLSFATKSAVLAVGGVMLVCIVLLILLGKQLNALSLGEDESKSLGINTQKLKISVVILATLASSLSVVLGGIIGWIGLIAPHICRFLFGADNRFVLSASALVGAIFLLICDTLSRQLYSYEIPIGIITSLFGIPIFIAVLFSVKGTV
ncbi:iron ABC transporter permease [Pasteurellaceae bacterium HPA106]|uniref:FecCD family ABC transporter permease n=1 Tax=Spirabiliibacterium pneumoniae TaxID=221400 RepID=UPI001AAD0609|nr:iron ABC transporter permease [Spirabiliibacterium pneumoniae]MBE2896626.1 iron ABC transporter permease [Spirabiliibacterium pneumoniae]